MSISLTMTLIVSRVLSGGESGEAWGWGDNAAGVLGVGSAAPYEKEARALLPLLGVGGGGGGGASAGARPVQIGCGFEHTLVRDASGRVWAWGAPHRVHACAMHHARQPANLS